MWATSATCIFQCPSLQNSSKRQQQCTSREEYFQENKTHNISSTKENKYTIVGPCLKKKKKSWANFLNTIPAMWTGRKQGHTVHQYNVNPEQGLQQFVFTAPTFGGVWEDSSPTCVNWGTREAVRKWSSKTVRRCPSCFWQPSSIPSTQNLTLPQPLQSPGWVQRDVLSRSQPRKSSACWLFIHPLCKETFSFISCWRKHTQTWQDLLVHSQDRTGTPHSPEQKKGFVVIHMCSSIWQDDTQTSQAIPKEITFIHSQNPKSELTQSQPAKAQETRDVSLNRNV